MTLIELLVVMGVVGLLLGISIPSLMGFANTVRLKTVLREVMSLVSLARSQAISVHENYAVIVDPEAREIRVVNEASHEPLEHVVRLPSSVTVELQSKGQASPETQFVFRPTGSLLGHTVSLILSDREKRYTVTVSGSTGAVSVSRRPDDA